MDPIIENLLRQNYTDDMLHTHVSMIQPHGKYQLNRQAEDTFWNSYCDEIEKGHYVYGIAEKPGNYVPVLVDVDLKIGEESNPMPDDHLYSPSQVKKVISIYQDILREIVEDVTDNNLMCVFLNKPPYRVSQNTKTLIKNGFHLHFPDCFLDKAEQETHLIPRVKQRMKEAQVFANLGIEDSGTVIDDSCCTVPWLLYGSKKEETAQPYLFAAVFDHNQVEISLEDAFKQYFIYDKTERVINLTKSKIRHYLPRILSIRVSGRETKEVKSGLIPPIRIVDGKVRKPKESQKIYDQLSYEANMKLAKDLLPMLADYRAEDYNEWMYIGWALFNISEGSEDGLQLWLEFSARCPEKFNEAHCRYEWSRMTRTNMSIGTIRYFAGVDSPEKYKSYSSVKQKQLMEDSLQGSHNDIAKLLHEEYGTEFVCASVQGKVWYQFTGQRWECIEEGVFLREKISSVIYNMFCEDGKKAFDMTDLAQGKTKTKQYFKLLENLKNANYKDNVMKEAREVFYDRFFKDKLDTDPYLIGFKNGVYDLKNSIFRSGRPEDYISKSMPINYRVFANDDEKVLEVFSFFEKVFPDKALRNYFMDTSSEIFVGGNFRKNVQMWIGEGDNGKSVTQMFFEHMLGPGYSIKVPTTLVTSKKPSSGSAWPELARAGNGVRAIWLEEVDETEAIYTGIFKHLSGNDSFVARDLFEKGKDMKEIKPMFKMFCISNNIIRFHGGGDKATWNRVRAIPFESTFCRESNPAPPTYEEQLRQKRFPMDGNFAQKVPTLVEAFAWVLLEHRKNPKSQVEPEKVRAATKMYREQNDIYRQFMEECIAEDPAKKLSLIELYAALVDWFKSSMGGERRNAVPPKAEVKNYFVKLWGEPESGMKWRGYKIRMQENDGDDAEDDEAEEVVVIDEEGQGHTQVDFSRGSPLKRPRKEMSGKAPL